MTSAIRIPGGLSALVLVALMLPGTAAAQTTECTDPFEATTDTAELRPGVAVQRGFCAPDRDGGDTDFFTVPTRDGHSYRIELIDRGPGFDTARFHIEDAYDSSGTVGFTGQSQHALTTRRLYGGHLTFSAQALAGASGFLPLAGQDLGYSILVTDLGPVPATRVNALAVSPTTVRGGAPATATITLDGAAPAGGATVTLTSSDRRVQIPTTVTVPAGSDHTTVALTTSRTRSSTGVTLTAAYGSTSASTVLFLSR